MLVSVIMPTYNCGAFIGASIESVLAQTVTDWELLIVDDCSTDNTANIVAAYADRDPRIHYSCLEKNSGPAAARTAAMARAAGKYLAFLDSDDLWAPEKLEKQIAFMESTGAAFSCTAYSLMDLDGVPLGTIHIPPKMTDYNRCIRLSNPFGNLTVMYDQEKLGRYQVPPILKRNDFALWLQILHDTDYCYGMPEVLASYRTGRSNSVSSGKLKLIKYHWQLYRQIEHHSILRSAFEICCWAFVKATGFGLVRRKV